eukprot:UN32652
MSDATMTPSDNRAHQFGPQTRTKPDPISGIYQDTLSSLQKTILENKNEEKTEESSRKKRLHKCIDGMQSQLDELQDILGNTKDLQHSMMQLFER